MNKLAESARGGSGILFGSAALLGMRAEAGRPEEAPENAQQPCAGDRKDTADNPAVGAP